MPEILTKENIILACFVIVAIIAIWFMIVRREKFTLWPRYWGGTRFGHHNHPHDPPVPKDVIVVSPAPYGEWGTYP